MSNVYELPERADPTEEAGDWIAKLDRGMNVQEEAALKEWLAADPRNSAALVESATLWDKMDCLARLAELFPQPARRESARARIGLALAATVLIIVLASYWSAAKEQTFQTAVGEHSAVTLPDGSEVTLNTNSLIRVRFTDRERLLLLDRGEVYVQVAHDRSRPLRVWVGDRFVEALGTAFNVAISEDQRVELIVTEGKVVVGVIDKNRARANAAKVQSRPAAVGTSVPVSAGERLLIGQGNSAVEALEREELEVQLSWRSGKLVFRGESLAEALAEIEKYTPVEFLIEDEDLKKVRIVGMFKAGDVDGLLATLRENFDITHQRIGDQKVILTSKSIPPGKGS